MVRRINAHAGPDDTAGGSEPGRDSGRYLAEEGHPLDEPAVISPDTHVGVDFNHVAGGTPHAGASPARPDALVEHGRVGDGHELE